MLEVKDYEVDPPRPAKLRGKQTFEKHLRGGLWIPASIMARQELDPVDPVAWAVLCCLLRYAGNRTQKNGTISLTNYAMAKYKVSRYQKRQALEKLVAHGLLTYTQKPKANPQVMLNHHLLK